MLRFLSNTHDPKDKYAKMYVARRFDETQEEAWRNHLAWLEGKVIGDPQATEAYTVAQLKELGMVGVYAQQSAHTDLLRADPRSAVAHPTSESTADNRPVKSATSG